MFQIAEFQGADGQPVRYGQLTTPGRPPTGRALWYVPGLGGSMKWALHFLEQLLPHFDVIYGTDLRGFGLNLPEGDEPQHSARIVEKDLECFYQQVIVPARHTDLTLCGLSLGGVFTTLMAVATPERFKRLVLLAPAYRPHPRCFSLSYTVRTTLAYLFLGKKARTTLPYGLPEITCNEAILNDPQYSGLPPMVLSPGFLLSTRDYCNLSFSATRRLSLPTMIVIPGRDIVCDPVAMRKAFENIPQTTLRHCREYPDFYHDVLFEAGHSEIAQEILLWIDSLASRSASAPSRQG